MTSSSRPVHAGRYRRITRFFAGVILHVIWWDLLLGRAAPGRVRRSRPRRIGAIARRFRELAVSMGGVLIKAGQFLSSRVDVLPAYVTDELAGLQDEVPPEPVDAMRRVIAEELGRPPEEVFAWFDDEPQAAASLGQTHRARLPAGASDSGAAAAPGAEPGGRPVIVKVQRPGIDVLVETDLAALRTVAGWLTLYPPLRRRVNLPALMNEFARTTWDEIDYEKEAANAERFAAVFADDASVRIPRVYRRYSTRRVLTLEDVEEIKITDVAAITAAGVSRAAVARKLFDVYLRQIFDEGFFHADPHPGNLFVRPVGPDMAVRPTVSAEPGPPGWPGGERPFQLVFVDFGMVGRVPPLAKAQLREILLALAVQDAHRIVQAYDRLGLLLPNADLRRVERATATMLERFWGQSITQLTRPDAHQVRDLLLEFRDVILDLPFQMPHDFIFLGRAVGILSGLATSLDPEFDPWSSLEAHAQRLVADQGRWPGARTALVLAAQHVQPFLAVPARLESVLRQAAEGRLEVRVAPDSALERDLRRGERAVDRLFWGVVFAALVLAGTLLYLSRDTTLGIVAWILALLALARGTIAGRRG